MATLFLQSNLKIVNYMHKIRVIIFLIIFTVSLPQKSYGSGEVDILKYFGCEGWFFAEIISRNPYPYSCTNQSLLNLMFLNVLTEGQAFPFAIRLKLNDEQILPNNCDRGNKIPQNDPSLNFGFCNNYMLLGTSLRNLFTTPPGQKVKMPDINEYTMKYQEKAGFYFVMGDISWDSFFVHALYRVQKSADRLCVQIFAKYMLTFVNVGCKFLEEPFKESIYDKLNTDLSDRCGTIYNCSKTIKEQSLTFTPVISTIVGCTRDMIVNILVNDKVCNPNSALNTEVSGGIAPFITDESLIHKFQRNMRKTVGAFLMLYVMFFGFKISLSPGSIKQKDISGFLFKLVLVTYFSIGITSTTNGQRLDGISGYVFPIMLSGLTDIASWMMAASSLNGLCDFPSKLYSDTSSLGAGMWDQIDCRLAYYVGYDGLAAMKMGITWKDQVAYDVPPYILLIIPSLYFGNYALAALAAYYPIMLISTVGYAVCLYLNSILMLIILGVLAPIFVPLCLFEQTKEYFTKWWKNLLALMLQPAIGILFLTIMFAAFDRAFYSTCVFKPINVHYHKNSGEVKDYRTFYISYEKNDYEDEFALMSCKLSIGSFFGGGATTNPDGSTYHQPSDVDIFQYDNFADRISQTDTDVFDGAKRPKLERDKSLFKQSPRISCE
ncbi:MAG: type IV secretion system protein [Rickettsiaceae bacterium]|nr:type IV secretion system protein [Rickettsiaceae bacterium]